ncbi:hypothetical protein EWM62_05445 [Mucilaginibacter terrigena]|uniref:Nuclear transport factor 2 family protein n=1 Tax=Mucilaginibacter terrigena TaxID=2492395 RepID=A0A4Q5LPP4_9SPHI|nr:hypothetical protein [Mucilaginibacter terrigena]RYU91386.1 hypothetical protein EWM62_05445 [Mucilaginibacter terrigena]
MKKKILITCLMWVLGGALVNATPDREGRMYDKVIKTFIESHMTSAYQKLNSVLADNAVFKLSRGEGILVQTKSALVEQLKKEPAINQNCDYSYDIMAESDAIVIAKVNFFYPDGVQENYLMLERNPDKEWKIANVYKMFPAKQEVNDTRGLVSK